MINEIEYTVKRKGVSYALHADKNVREKNAWHLATIGGNGMPPSTAKGGASFGIAGQSYSGLAVDAREIEVDMYADGFSPDGCQQMLDDAARVVSPENEALGILKLTNARGDAYRIAAKAIEFDVSKTYRRTALASMVFHCPYAYFESDVLNVAPVFAVEGGKEYPINEGLERPYTFGDIPTAEDLTQTVTAYNAGDVAAPCVLKLHGAGLSRVELVNETTGESIIVNGMNAGGIEINTDENDLYARFEDGKDASAYVSLYSELSAFKLEPGANVLRVSCRASSVTAAGARIEWRGRFSACL